MAPVWKILNKSTVLQYTFIILLINTTAIHATDRYESNKVVAGDTLRIIEIEQSQTMDDSLGFIIRYGFDKKESLALAEVVVVKQNTGGVFQTLPLNEIEWWLCNERTRVSDYNFSCKGPY